MRRRVFIGLVGGAAAWSLDARAQQSGELPTIGILGGDATDFGHAGITAKPSALISPTTMQVGAKALGLDVPATLLARADKMIERGDTGIRMLLISTAADAERQRGRMLQ